jgi:tetratricopeptide (TPR) repeat protein
MEMRLHAIVSLLMLLAVPPALAVEESEILVSRGLVEFHQRDYPSALKSFDGAVKADPVNVEARHFRAMTWARLGDLDEAIFDLLVVLELKPDFYEAALQLGVARLQQGDATDAVRWLERARQSPALDADASLLIGIARLHLNQTEAAAAALERARQKEELRVTADYYSGVASFRRWQWDDAEQRFAAAQTAGPDTTVARQAGGFLRQLRPYHLYAGIGLDYDTNVVLAPSNNSVKADVGVTNQSDGRVSLAAGGTLVPWRNDRVRLVLGYDFFQSFQFQLTQYDLQAHRPGAQVLFDAGPFQGGVSGRYGYYLLRTDSFLQDGAAAAWLSIPESDVGRTELYYAMLVQDFYLSPFRGVRNSINNGGGFRQYFYLPRPERHLFFGYRYESQDALETQGDAFAFDANQFEAGVGWDLTPTLDGTLRYGFRHENYAPASNGRIDNTNHVAFALRQALGDWFWLSFAYLGTFNDSNQTVFTYDRNIVSIGFEGRY